LERDRDYVLKPQRKMHEIADQWGIPFCDLYRELDVRSFSDALHLTKEGRELAGKRIAECLLNSGLLPGRAALAGEKFYRRATMEAWLMSGVTGAT
jgi:hypothetical protein